MNDLLTNSLYIYNRTLYIYSTPADCLKVARKISGIYIYVYISI